LEKPLSLPLVSICIPTFRQIDYLRDTLLSVQAQDFEDYELIISDDTPDDTVKQLVESFGFDHRLRYYHNAVALGSPENWNAAVSYAQGKFIKLLHHDDRFSHSGALGIFVSLLDENPDANFAFSASSAGNIKHGHSHDHRPSEEQLASLHVSPAGLFISNFIGAPSATIYRSGLGIEYDGALKWLVDVDFYIQVLRKNSHFAYTSEVLVATATNASHQVTELCKNNASIDIFEHLYEYNKIIDLLPYETSVRDVWFRLFERYQVYTYEDLSRCGSESLMYGDLILPFFNAYSQVRLQRTPYRIYARLPEIFKRVIRFFVIR
jgi:glycosyltransferase involved in cell wall biosynthesis